MKRFIEISSLSVISLINLAAVALILYATNKGIDFSDESFHLLFSSSLDQPVNFSAYKYDILFKSLHMEFSIMEIRLIRFFSLLMGVAFLSNTIIKKFSSKKVNPFITINSILLATIIIYVRGAHSLSYNTIILILTIFLTGLFLKSLASPKKWLPPVLSSLLLYGVYVTKFPSSILFLGLILGALFLFALKDKAYWITLRNYLICLIVVWGILFVLHPKTKILTTLDVISNLNYGDDYSIASMLNSFFLELVYLFAFFCFGILIRFFHSTVKFKHTYSFTLCLIFVGLGYSYFVNWQVHFASIRIPLFLMLLNGFYVQSFMELELKLKIVILIMFATPFTLAFGSNNPLNIHLNYFTPFWIIVIATLALKGDLQSFLAPTLLFTSLLVSYEIRDNLIRHPYHQESLSQNTELIQYNGSNHYISKQSKENLDKLKNLLKESPHESEYMLAVSRLVGEVLFTGKKFPSTPIWSKDRLDDWLKNNPNLPEKFYFLSNHSQNLTLKLIDKIKGYNQMKIGEYIRENHVQKKETILLYFLSKP